MSPDAEAQLARWGLDQSDVERAGLFEVPDASALYAEMPAAPALVIPYFDQRGELRQYLNGDGSYHPYARVRWLRPIIRAPAFGKPHSPQRYSQPRRSGVAAYFPPGMGWQAIADDPRQPIALTEGEAKALCAAKYGFSTIAFGGVYSFQDRNGELLPELDAITWRDRDVFVVYDSDAVSNPQVMAAESRLAEQLQRQRGARLRIVRLPSSDKGNKQGLDDFIVANGPVAFRQLCYEAENLSVLDAQIIKFNQTCAWIEREGGVYDMARKLHISKINFVQGSHYSTHTHTVTTKTGTKEINVASKWLTHPMAQRFSEVLFRPGEPATLQGVHGIAVNLWEGFENAEPGPVQPFLDFTDWLFQNLQGEDRWLPLRLIAYKAQNPQAKIPLALIMVGPEGAGKSLWAEVLVESFGSYGKNMTADVWLAKFNGWIEKCLLGVIDEAEVLALTGNAARARGLISQKVFPMEEKFRPLREVNNYGLFIINSNKRALASYGFDDRRMVVVNIPPKREPEFYAAVKAWRVAGGASHMMHWLLTTDLQGWEPPYAAPVTAEKSVAYAEGMTPIQQLADDMRNADTNIVMKWFMAAEQWARAAENSSNHAISAQARATLNGLPQLQVRPWYTSAELAMLFPMVMAQSQGRFNMDVSAGQLSRFLREAGIPYLICADNERGFMIGGQLRQYLVVADFEEWSKPLRQADFERLLRTAPTVAQLRSVKK